MTTTRIRPARWHAERCDASEAQLHAYRQLLALAIEVGLEYEVERLTMAVAEMTDERDADIEHACDHGYTPEDLWGE